MLVEIWKLKFLVRFFYLVEIRVGGIIGYVIRFYGSVRTPRFIKTILGGLTEFKASGTLVLFYLLLLLIILLLLLEIYLGFKVLLRSV